MQWGNCYCPNNDITTVITIVVVEILSKMIIFQERE